MSDWFQRFPMHLRCVKNQRGNLNTREILEERSIGYFVDVNFL